MTPWKLKRVHQCEKCPWIVGVDPHDIPDGYSEEKHRAAESMIARPGDPFDERRPAMACHETGDAYCVGWLAQQLGPGNNIRLRIRMLSCENARAIKFRGEQHKTFADTLPETSKGKRSP